MGSHFLYNVSNLPSYVRSMLRMFTYLVTDWGINLSYIGVDIEPFQVVSVEPL